MKSKINGNVYGIAADQNPGQLDIHPLLLAYVRDGGAISNSICIEPGI